MCLVCACISWRLSVFSSCFSIHHVLPTLSQSASSNKSTCVIQEADWPYSQLVLCSTQAAYKYLIRYHKYLIRYHKYLIRYHNPSQAFIRHEATWGTWVRCENQRIYVVRILTTQNTGWTKGRPWGTLRGERCVCACSAVMSVLSN